MRHLTWAATQEVRRVPKQNSPAVLLLPNTLGVFDRKVDLN